MRDFRKLKIKSFYSTTGKRILQEVINPLLKESKYYDRLTGFFSVQSLVSIASGLEFLYRVNGKMRLVIGIHNVDADLIAAREIGELLPIQIVEEYKARFFQEVGKLSELTEKSSIAGIAWMLRLGLLEVRVASPKSSGGIYHQKRMIFRDDSGNVVAGTGSLNETIGGLYNVEEMQFNFSWKSEEDLTRALVESFNEIWSGTSEYVDTVPLDEAFANELIQLLGNAKNPFEEPRDERREKNSSLVELVDLMRKSPIYAPFNLSLATLYPHQERVFSEALSRWPIRVMLADEVGLGKTLEAGVLISYILKMNIARSITILCPAGLMRQWQEEMQRHFDLDFHIFDSSRGDFVSTSKQRVSQRAQSDLKIDLRLISTQWARLNEERFTESLTDCLFVDEAHAARVNHDAYGTKSTRLWRLLNTIKDEIPHLVLLTATPMQVHASEYHGLLRILGLPKQWENFLNYEQSLKLIASEEGSLQLHESKVVADLLLSAFQEYNWLPELLTRREALLVMELRQASESSKTAPAILVQQNLSDFRLILTKIHPAHFLTCRNTKSGLTKFGYKFPLRQFEAPKIVMNGLLERYELAVESYLSNAYGKTEESLKPSGKFPIGFAKSGYYQRLVSSLYASRSSLKRRKEKLENVSIALDESNSELVARLLANFDIEDDEIERDEFGDLSLPSPKATDLNQVVANVKRMISLEKSYIEELIQILERLGEGIEKHDPKFTCAMEILRDKLDKGPVLVFSRYTDTLEGFLKLFDSSTLRSSVQGFALYTGGAAWIQTNLGRFEATKSDVTDALNAKKISIVFCSDAASEGLNLQAASTLINLDVPWNPARLEQRIGRIARLGQKASNVEIYNLWYPESIEAKMYTRLLSRQSDYELAVGEAADIFSDAIKREVASKFDAGQALKGDGFFNLKQIREDFQRRALERIWQRGGGLPPASSRMRSDILVALQKVDSSEETSQYSSVLTVDPGTPNSFTLLHNAFDELAKFGKVPSPSDGVELCALISNNIMFGLCVRDSQNRNSILNVLALGVVFQAMLGIQSLRNEDFFALNVETVDLAAKLRQLILECESLPNHNHARVPFRGLVSPNIDFGFDKIEIKKLCKVQLNLTA